MNTSQIIILNIAVWRYWKLQKFKEFFYFNFEERLQIKLLKTQRLTMLAIEEEITGDIIFKLKL
jgi:hypothetical protein